MCIVLRRLRRSRKSCPEIARNVCANDRALRLVIGLAWVYAAAVRFGGSGFSRNVGIVAA